jgi:hypothetical protein
MMATSAYDTTENPYTNTATDQAEQDRQNKLDVATLNAITKVSAGSSPAGTAPAANPAGAPGPTPQQMGVQPTIAGSMQSALSAYSPTPGQAPSGIEDFVSFGSNPMETALRAKAAQANMDQLNNPGAAFDTGAQASRENLDISQRNARDQTRDDLAKTYGGNASQVTTALRDADQQAILNRRGLNSDLATGRANAVQQTTAQAIQNALGFAGIGSQEKIAKAQIQQQDKAQTSQEKLAYAGLAQNDKLQTQQMQTQLDVAKMQIGSAEKLQANQQAFDGAQEQLKATLAKEMQGNEISAQTALQRSQQDFQSLMQDKGYLQTKDIETLKNEFAQDLQRNGFTQETAMQAAEFQAQALQAKSLQEFEAKQADLTRAFTSGERIATEDFTKNLTALQDQQQERMAKLTSDLGLTAIDKQAGYQQALQAAQQAHESALQKNSLDAAGAQQAADQAFQKAMQVSGFSDQQILQAQAAQYQAAETDKQLKQQYVMFTAQEAQQDKQFAADLGIKQEQVDAQKDQFAKDFGLQLQQFGIQQDAWETTKTNQKFQDDLNLAMTGIQMWDGKDPNAIAPFVQRLATTMGQQLGMDPATLQQAISQELGGEKTTATNTEADRIAGVQKEKTDMISTLTASQKAPNGEYVKSINTGFGTAFNVYWNPDTTKYETGKNDTYSVLYR